MFRNISGIPSFFNIGDVRVRHCSNLSCENTKSFSNDPEDPSAAALKVSVMKNILEEACKIKNLSRNHGMKKRNKLGSLHPMDTFPTGSCFHVL